MRIDLNQSAQGLPESGRTSAPNSTNQVGSTPASSALGEDQAQLSGMHAQVQTLVAQAAQLPDMRQEKVNALRQVVQAGSYQPTSDQIADAMVEHLLVMPAA